MPLRGLKGGSMFFIILYIWLTLGLIGIVICEVADYLEDGEVKWDIEKIFCALFAVCTGLFFLIWVLKDMKAWNKSFVKFGK